jgi:hypothetical protein
MDYTRFQHVGIYNCLKSLLLFNNYPEYTPHSCIKYKVKRSGNSTFNFASGVDHFAFDYSTDYKSSPKADLHSKIDKQGTTNMHLIYKLMSYMS